MLHIINNQELNDSSDESSLEVMPDGFHTNADLIVDYLEKLGIDTVFGVPGGAIEPFFNSLARSQRRGKIKLVVARHETAAAFMADGYFRETGKMGVVCSTTGPGATNLITGVASALADEIPMLVITAQTPLPKFGKRALQESSCTAIDTVAIFRQVTSFNTLVSHPEQLEAKLVSAIMAAHRAPHGPVHISVPSDVLRAPADLRPHIHSDLLVQNFNTADDEAITKLCEKLGRVDNVVLYVGNGVGKASRHIMEFAELTNANIITGPMGKSWVDETHPLYRGVYGFAGHKSANELLQNPSVNLIIAVGTALGELGTSGWKDDLLNTKLVHIDSSIEHFSRSPMANLHVFGNIETIFKRVVNNIREAKTWGRKWQTVSPLSDVKNIVDSSVDLLEPEKCVSNASPILPQRLFHQLALDLPSDTRVHIDAGNSWAWATHYFNRASHNGLYRISMGFGSMAWSLGAAIGSSVANRKAPTMCIIGDGSYLMSSNEITAAVQLKLPVVILLLNDAAMGMVMHGQKLGGQESIGWELNLINYAAVATALGANGIEVQTSNDLNALDWNDIFNRDGPTLIDVRIDRDQVPPMGDRIRGLAVDGSATPGG